MNNSSSADDESPAVSTPDTPAPRRRPRWWLAVLILLGGAIYIGLVWLATDVPTDERVFSTLNTIIVSSLLLVVWLLFLSRLTWKACFRLVGAVVCVSLVAGILFRVDGVSGDMVPAVRWRWAARPQQPPPLQVAPPAAATADVDALDLPQNAYPGFQGLERNATVTGVALATDWIAHPPQQLWKQPVGAGWSAFAIEGTYAITQEMRDDQEVVVAYDLLTGAVRWWHASESGTYQGVVAGDGPRATPTIHEDRVYALGSLGQLVSLGLDDGKPHWSVNIVEDNEATQDEVEFGRSCSPLVVDDLVIVTVGGPGRTVAAYDRHTGERVWRSGDDAIAYASPSLADWHGESCILVFSKNALTAFGARAGEVHWSFDWPTGLDVYNVAQPVLVDSNRVAIFTGFGVGGAMIEVPTQDGSATARELWRSRWLRPNLSNVIHHDGYLYGLDGGILVCLDAANGERKWKQGRYGHGQLLLINDVLLVQCETGEIALVAAQPDRHQEFARQEALSGKSWNHPAWAAPYLLLRNSDEAVCFRLSTR